MLDYLREYGFQLVLTVAVIAALVWAMNKTGGTGG